MRFKLIVDKNSDEEVIAKVHERSSLTDEIESLILRYSGKDHIIAYGEEDIKMLALADVECITVQDGKTYAVDLRNQRYRLKQRLYELEATLPSNFIRINKSALANEARLDRFATTYSGCVDAVFRCGYREYVSRRCFAQIKRRFDIK